MFQELLGKVKENVSTARSIIKTNDRLRDIAFGGDITTKRSFESLIEDIPSLKEWRVYDHCSIVTRLYAIYENFVENLVKRWLEVLPELFPLYSELEERIRNTHQLGVGKLILELKKNRYKHLSIDEVVCGLFRGVTGDTEYDLLPDAFLFHEQNLRKDILEKLLADAGIPNAWNWIDKHKAIKNFVEEIRGSQNTAEGELEELISYRNDAAHGAPINDILSSGALLEQCDFVEALCQALAELVTYQVIKRKKVIGQVKEIGRVTEWFQKSKAAIATVEETTLSVGISLFLVGETSSCCQLATIESIQLDSNPIETLQTTTGMEVGLKFDIDARKGLRLYMLMQAE
jgi:hypothetical protein